MVDVHQVEEESEQGGDGHAEQIGGVGEEQGLVVAVGEERSELGPVAVDDVGVQIVLQHDGQGVGGGPGQGGGQGQGAERLGQQLVDKVERRGADQARREEADKVEHLLFSRRQPQRAQQPVHAQRARQSVRNRSAAHDFLPPCSDALSVSLTRRAHKRDYIRQQMVERFDWPEDMKLPIVHRRDARGQVVQQVPLLGNSLKLGEVYMSLPIGTPAQNYTAQVDTGSADLGLPDTDCTSCGKVADVYNPALSKTSQVVGCSNSTFTCPTCSSSQCSYKIAYGDGSGFSARLYTDELQIGALAPVRQALGGIYQETPPFEPYPVDGIVGIGYQRLSETNAPTIVDSLVNSGQIANRFSMCLTDDGGTFEFGGQLPYSQGVTQSTPIVKQLFYQVSISDMSINGQSFGVAASAYNTGGAIFDSGTTEFLLPRAAYAAFKTMLLNNCTANPLVGLCNAGSNTIFDGACFALTPAQIAAYPPITIHFGAATLVVPPQYYILTGGCVRSNLYSLYIDQLGPGEGTILGDVVHRPYVVLYDRANVQISWTPVKDCPDGNL